MIGPDEYHETIDDNAFTNVMACWSLARGLDVARLVSERWPARWASLAARLALDAAERDGWRTTLTTMATGLDPAIGLFEPFQGYSALEPIDPSACPRRSMPMDVVLGRERK